MQSTALSDEKSPGTARCPDTIGFEPSWWIRTTSTFPALQRQSADSYVPCEFSARIRRWLVQLFFAAGITDAARDMMARDGIQQRLVK